MFTKKNKPFYLCTYPRTHREIPLSHIRTIYGLLTRLGWTKRAIHVAELTLDWPLEFSRRISKIPPFWVWFDNEGFDKVAR